mgnify:CR=1 FL=1
MDENPYKPPPEPTSDPRPRIPTSLRDWNAWVDRIFTAAIIWFIFGGLAIALVAIVISVVRGWLAGDS